MSSLGIDFETRSTVDLKTAGLANYAAHPTTEPILMSFRFDKGPVRRWHRGEPLPDDVRQHVESGGVVRAWNAAFEIALWNGVCVPRYGWPVLRVEQCRCSMAASYAMSLPGALEKAAPAAGVKAQKDMVGHRLMLQLCKPREIKPDGTAVWWESPEQIARLGDYCDVDILTECEMADRLMPLSTAEQAIWVLDQKINNRGIYVDLPAVEAAIEVVNAEADRLNADMRAATGNFVGFTTETARIKKWIEKQGITTKGVAKNDVIALLDNPATPADVRAVLNIRKEAGKSSTAKLVAMREATSADSRLRGMFQYHGAGTGRWAGRRVQLQNLPRPEIEQHEIEKALEALIEIDDPVQTAEYFATLYGSPLDVVSWSLRGFLRAAPGHELLVADFANIEGRVLAWLAGEEWKLEAFREYDAGTGPDLYLVTAGHVLGKHHSEVTKSERQSSGKVPELACGYQGGVGAFQNMAKVYNVHVSDTHADQIKEAWRQRHPKIRNYWFAVDAAFKDALRHKGAKVSAGPRGREVTYKVNGSFLWCRLPSGRVLCYPYARLDTCMTYKTPEGLTKKLSERAVSKLEKGVPEDWVLDRTDDDVSFYMTVDGTTNKWVETDTYGGKNVENIDQAVSRDLMAQSMVRVESEGYPVVIHVHDEIGAEVRAGERDLQTFEFLCAQTEKWAAGLPVAAKGWRGVRYRKD